MAQESDLQRSTPPVRLLPDDGAGLRVSLIDLALRILRHPRLLVTVPLALLVPTVMLLYGRPRPWVATSTIMPELSGSGAQRLAGLAAQFGLSAGQMTAGETLDSYVQLMHSRSILEPVVRARYTLTPSLFRSDTVQGDLIQLYGLASARPDERLKRAVEQLGDNLSASVNAKAGVVTLRTTATSPQTAEAINRNILDAVAEFNVRRRQSRAVSERDFVEARLAQVQRDVRAAEEAQRAFQERNRQSSLAPQLRLESERLQRRVDLAQQVYSTLAQAYEQSKIDAVRNTPVFTIVDPPEGSARVAFGRVARMAVVLLVGIGAAIFLALLMEAFKTEAQRQPAELAELRRRLDPRMAARKNR